MISGRNSTESKIVRVFWNDGLLDILAGIGVLAIGIGWQFDLVLVSAIAPPILVPLWKPLRRRLTEPNLGYVEFSDRQLIRKRSFLKWAIGMGIVTLSLGIGVYLTLAGKGHGFDLKFLVQGLPAVILGGMAFMTAAVTSLHRFHFYSAMLVLFGIMTSVFDWGPALPMIVNGSMMLLLGIVTLLRFLHIIRFRRGLPQEGSADV